MAEAAEPQTKYESVLSGRYCRGSPLLQLFSERHRVETWRRLWCWLAQAQSEMTIGGVTAEMVKEMESQVSNIDWSVARAEERRVRHDVMAHIHTFEAVCPTAAGCLHLGATSCFVTDNADLIILREAANILNKRLATCVHRLLDFVHLHRAVPVVGRTHYQPASLTTVGKRVTLWASDLLLALNQLQSATDGLVFRGVKGATGTLHSFMCLGMDWETVQKLNNRVTQLAGFEKSHLVTGQTYPRLQDAVLVNALSLCASAVHKICMDIRLWQSFGEVQEPFESEQVGSSAMPYKRNPMRSERCCGLARFVMNLAPNSLQTAAVQGFERTLDDSVNRRILFPDAFLSSEAMLSTLQNIVEGLTINANTINANVNKELPFLALEKILMALTEEGISRQDAHAKIRLVALSAAEKRENGEKIDLASMLAEDNSFENILERAKQWSNDPETFTGFCKQQVDEFINNIAKPTLKKYNVDCNQKATLDI